MSHDRYYYDCEPEYYYSRPRYYGPVQQSRPEVREQPQTVAYVEQGQGGYTFAGASIPSEYGGILEGAAVPMMLAGLAGIVGLVYIRTMYGRRR